MTTKKTTNETPRNPKFKGNVAVIDSTTAIGGDLEWSKFADLINEDILILQTQFRMRQDPETHEDYEEVVILYRFDDDSLEPEHRVSSRHTAVLRALKAASTPVIVTVRKNETAKRPYYYLDRPEWATDADNEPAF